MGTCGRPEEGRGFYSECEGKLRGVCVELRLAAILFVFSSDRPGCSAGGKGEGLGVSRSDDGGVGVDGVTEGSGHHWGPHGRWCH